MPTARLFLLIVSLISIVGCTLPFASPTADCLFIHDSPLRDIGYENQSALETEQFLVNAFPEMPSAITYNEYRVAENDMADYEMFQWKREGSQYEVVLVEDRAIYAEVEFNGTITIEQITRCLGKPEYYLAYVMVHNLVVFELWYPAQGITLHNNFVYEPDFRINEATTMERIFYSKVTTDPNEVKNDLSFVSLPTVHEREQALLKPWTDDWNDIVIESFLP